MSQFPVLHKLETVGDNLLYSVVLRGLTKLRQIWKTAWSPTHSRPSEVASAIRIFTSTHLKQNMFTHEPASCFQTAVFGHPRSKHFLLIFRIST